MEKFVKKISWQIDWNENANKVWVVVFKNGKKCKSTFKFGFLKIFNQKTSIQILKQGIVPNLENCIY